MRHPIPLGPSRAAVVRNRAHAQERPRAPWRSAWLAACLGALLVGSPAAAQENASLASLDARHQSAEQAHIAALAAAEAQRLLLDEELERVNLARSQGDEDALGEALRRFQAASKELMRLEDRTRDTESTLFETRRALLRGLDQARTVLEAQLTTAADPQSTMIIYARLEDVTNQYQEIEGSLFIPTTPVALFSQSSIVFDDRDGRDELQTKAEILERRAQDADSLTAEYQRQIERLESRLRLERNSRDFLGSVERFGDNQLPAIAARPESVHEEGVPADADAVEQSAPLEQRIEELRTTQDRLRQQRQSDLDLAREFRERLMQIIE